MKQKVAPVLMKWELTAGSQPNDAQARRVNLTFNAASASVPLTVSLSFLWMQADW